MRDADEGREDVAVEAVGDDESSRSEQPKACDGLRPGALVLAGLCSMFVCPFVCTFGGRLPQGLVRLALGVFGFGFRRPVDVGGREFPIDLVIYLVIYYISDGATEVQVVHSRLLRLCSEVRPVSPHECNVRHKNALNARIALEVLLEEVVAWLVARRELQVLVLPE